MNLFLSVSTQEKINFARYLHLMIKSGLSLSDGLDLIKKQASSRSLKKIVGDVVTDIRSGKLLAESLGKYKGVFGDFFIYLVRAGEESGW